MTAFRAAEKASAYLPTSDTISPPAPWSASCSNFTSSGCRLLLKTTTPRHTTAASSVVAPRVAIVKSTTLLHSFEGPTSLQRIFFFSSKKWRVAQSHFLSLALALTVHNKQQSHIVFVLIYFLSLALALTIHNKQQVFVFSARFNRLRFIINK